MDDAAAGAAVRVLVRVRPYNGRELEKQGMDVSKTVVSMTDATTTIVDPFNDYRTKDTFVYDKCFWSLDQVPANTHCPRQPAASYAEQEDVYRHIGPQMIENVWAGYNTCLFAYGQTSSGKTHTMMGDLDSSRNKGIIPRLCQDLFDRIKQEQSEQPTLSFKVDASYHEIYNERVKDLLCPKHCSLRVRQHPVHGPFVEGLSYHQVNDFEGVAHFLRKGDIERSTATTFLNDRSSRSHAIFTLTMTKLEMVGNVANTIQTKTRISKVNLVDLAGSERVAMSGVQGERFEEAKNINLSLTTLGRVIDCLVERSDGKVKPSLPPYRESVLTWLLSDSLGGNSKTFMIATISPAAVNFNETLSTLRYSAKARSIINLAMVNKEEESGKLVAELRSHIQTLQQRLRKMEKQEKGATEVLEERCISAETEVESLREQIALLEKQGAKRSRDEEERLARSLKEEKAKCRRLEKQVKKLEHQTEVNQFNYGQEVQDLANQLAAEQRRNKLLQGELDAKEEEIRRLFDTQESIMAERDAAVERMERVSLEGDTREKDHRINVLRRIARDMEDAKERAEAKAKEMVHEKRVLEKELHRERAEHAVVVRRMEETVASARETAASKVDLLREKDSRIRDLVVELNTVKGRLSGKKSEESCLEEVRKKSDELLRETTEAFQYEIMLLKTELRNLTAGKDKLVEENNTLHTKLVEMEQGVPQEVRRLQSEVEAAKASVVKQKEEAGMLTTMHRQLLAEHHKTTEALLKVQAEKLPVEDGKVEDAVLSGRSGLQERLRQAEAERDELRGVRSELEGRVRELEVEGEATVQRMEEVRAELENKVVALEAVRNELEHKVASGRENAERLKTEVSRERDAQCVELGALKKELSTAQNTVKVLEAELLEAVSAREAIAKSCKELAGVVGDKGVMEKKLADAVEAVGVLERDKATVARKCEVLEEEVGRSANLVAEREATISKLERTLKEAEGAKASLRSELAERVAEIMALRLQLETAAAETSSRIAVKEKEVDEARKACLDLEGELEEAKKEIAKGREAVEASQRMIADLTAHCAAAETKEREDHRELDQVRGEVLALEKERDAKAVDVEQLQRRVEELEAQAVEARQVADEVQTLKAEVVEKESQLEVGRRRVASLSETLEAKGEEVEKATRLAESYKMDRAALTSQVGSLKEQVDKLQSELAGVTAERTKGEEEIATLERKVALLAETERILLSKEEVASAAQAQMAHLEAEVKQHESEVVNLRDKVHEGQHTIAELTKSLEQTTQEKERLCEENQRLRLATAAAQEEACGGRKRADELAELLAAAQCEMEVRERDSEAKATAHSQLQQRARSLELEVKRAVASQKGAEGEVAELKRQLAQHTDEVATLKSQVAELRRAGAQHTLQLETLQREKARAEEVAESASAELRRVQDRLGSTQKELAVKTKALDTDHAEAMELRRTTHEEVVRIRQLCDQYQKQVATLEQERAALRERLTSQQQKNGELQLTVAKNQQLLDDLRKSRTKAEGELCELTTLFAAKEAEAVSLQEEVRKLRAEGKEGSGERRRKKAKEPQEVEGEPLSSAWSQLAECEKENVLDRDLEKAQYLLSQQKVDMERMKEAHMGGRVVYPHHFLEDAIEQVQRLQRVKQRMVKDISEREQRLKDLTAKVGHLESDNDTKRYQHERSQLAEVQYLLDGVLRATVPGESKGMSPTTSSLDA